jgi:hypothetical protein
MLEDKFQKQSGMIVQTEPTTGHDLICFADDVRIQVLVTEQVENMPVFGPPQHAV